MKDLNLVNGTKVWNCALSKSAHVLDTFASTTEIKVRYPSGEDKLWNRDFIRQWKASDRFKEMEDDVFATCAIYALLGFVLASLIYIPIISSLYWIH